MERNEMSPFRGATVMVPADPQRCFDRLSALDRALTAAVELGVEIDPGDIVALRGHIGAARSEGLIDAELETALLDQVNQVLRILNKGDERAARAFMSDLAIRIFDIKNNLLVECLRRQLVGPVSTENGHDRDAFRMYG